MKKNKKQKKSLLKFLFLGGFLLFLFKKEEKKNGFNLKDLEHNFLDFAHKEEKVFDDLRNHKENAIEYVEDSTSIFRDYFIPHKGNNHHPKLLQKKSLIIISILAITLKLSLVSYLFFIYPNDAQMSEDLGAEVFQLLNEERVKAGLNTLNQNKVLITSAYERADDMITNDYFAHKSLDGRMPWDWVSRNDYPYLFIGENLGMSFSSAESVHRALMNSPSHKKNILNNKYTDVGVVVRRGVINGKETNVLVQLFGSKKVEEIIPNPAFEKLAVAEKVEVEKEKLVVKKEATEEGVTKTPTKEVVQEKPASVKGLDNQDNAGEKTIENIPEKKIALASKEEIESLKNKIEEKFEKRDTISSTSALLLGDRARSYVKKKSPEVDLKKDLNTKIEFIADSESNNKYTIAAKISDYSNFILLGLLILMSVALFLNIFIRLEVQHKPAIVQTLLLLVLLVGLYSTRLHFLEDLPNYITIF